MTPEVRCLLGDHDDMPDTRVDGGLAAGAQVGLPRLVRLDGVDEDVRAPAGHPKKPQRTNPMITMANPTTSTTSNTDLRLLRNGLKPTP